MSRLTKSQRRRRNQKLRREQERHWSQAIGPMPIYESEIASELGENTELPREPWQRAPLHMIDHDLQAIDPHAQADLWTAPAQCRSDDRLMRIAEMRKENRDIWLKRGAARIIASRWNRLHPDDSVTVRTVQSYVQSSKK